MSLTHVVEYAALDRGTGAGSTCRIASVQRRTTADREGARQLSRVVAACHERSVHFGQAVGRHGGGRWCSTW